MFSLTILHIKTQLKLKNPGFNLQNYNEIMQR